MDVGPKNRIVAEDGSANVKLDSWKAIAAYLDRDPRTVQLWEKQEGFPVHRLAHSSRSSVYAFTAEIDAWLRARSTQRVGPPPAKELPAPPPEPRKSTLQIVVPAAAALLCLGLAAAWLLREQRLMAAPPAAKILAVLPFQNQTSMDSSMADALTGSVIGDIGRLGKIPVVSRHSSMELADVQLPVRQIASELHASLILRGTVAQVGDQMQATVELLGGPDFNHLWGATYRRKVVAGELAGNEIASSIAIDLTRKLTGSVPPVVFPDRSVDPRARQAYLTARFYWSQRDLAGLRKAIALYRQALAIDPKYAAAYAGLAECYDLMTDRGVMTEQAAFTQAKTAAQAALSADSNSAEAYSALAFAVYRQDWDFVRAELLFKKAIALDPNSAVSHQWYGEFLGDLRRFDESIAELRKAKELDPLSPMAGADLADGYLHAGRGAEAEHELRRLLDLYPDFLPADLYSIGLSVHQGNLARAEASAQAYFQLSGDRTPLRGVRILRLIAAGKDSPARQEETRLLGPAARPALSPYARAQFLFTMGRIDDGYAALEQAYHDHSWWMVTMLVDPAFDDVRDQPRFLEIARRVGLPVDAKPRLLARAQ